MNRAIRPSSPITPSRVSMMLTSKWGSRRWWRLVTIGLAVAASVVGSIAASGASAGWTWSSSAQLPAGVFSLSCASSTLCVAGTNEGLFVSTNPGGGSAAWIQSAEPPYPVGFGPEVHGVACPTTTMCVGVGVNSIISSSNPANGASAWVDAPVSMPSTQYFEGVACASSTFCVAFAVSSIPGNPAGPAPRNGIVYTSTDPTGGTSAWYEQRLPDVVTYATCLASACVLSTYGGDFLITRDLKTDAPRWTKAHQLGPAGKVAMIPAVACSTLTYCIAPIGGVTVHGELIGSLTSRRAFSWKFTQGLGGARYPGPDGVVCLAHGFCVVGAQVGSPPKSRGEIMIEPSRGAPWLVQNVAANSGVVVSCVSTTLCVAGETQMSNNGVLSGTIVVGTP